MWYALSRFFMAFVFLISLLSCGKSPEKARKELGQMNIDYTDESFKKYVERGDRVVVDLFLTAGINSNLRDEDDVPVLFFAIAKKKDDIVKLLIEKGADVNARTNNGLTPLMVATLSNQTEIMKALLKKGADINAKTPDITSADILAAKKGFFNETFLDLLKKEHEKQGRLQSSSGLTALMLAVQQNVETVATLVEKGADINLVINNEQSALLFAINIKKVEIVKYLLEKGANPNIRASTQTDNLPVFYLAIKNQDKEILKALLEKGADANATASTKEDGETQNYPILVLAVHLNSDKEIVKTLIDYGADVNAQDSSGETAIRAAKRLGYIKIVDLLKNNGAKE